MSDAERDREARIAASLGMSVGDFRRRYAPWRLQRARAHATKATPARVGKPSPTRRAEVYERDQGLCRYCGVTVEAEGPRMFTVDHVVPRAKGGTNRVDNLVVACFTCNHEKGGRLLAETGMTLRPIGYRKPEPRPREYVKARKAHQRDHWRTDGTPKRSYTADQARAAAAELTSRDGLTMEPFPCRECDAWHIRILGGAFKLRRRRARRDLTEELTWELGPRVVAHMKVENEKAHGTRRAVIARRFATAVKLGIRSLNADAA